MASFFLLSSFILAIIPFLLFFLLTKINNKSKLNNNNNTKPPPPGEFGWPILGESLEFTKSPSNFIHDRMKKHSPKIFQTSLGWEKVVFFCGPLANKFIYSNEEKFQSCLPRSMADALAINLKSPLCVMFAKEMHNFLKVQSLVEYVSQIDIKTRDHFQKYWNPNNEVKVYPLSKEFTFFLGCNLLFNFDKDSIKELSKPFFIVAEGFISLPVNFPGTAYNKALKASRVLLDKLIVLIMKRKADLLNSIEGKDDLLSQVLRIFEEEQGSYEEMAGMMIGLLFASFHTTSNAITFTLNYLAEYPEVHAKVLQEQLAIAQSKGEDELLTWKDIQKMKYTWNVVCETMRIRPPGLGGFRENLTDISFADFTVPKGSKVHWNTYSTHMDPTYFPNPEKFDPSRFDGDFPPNVYVPFGGGPRMCCGREYARIEILVYLHNVVTRFRFSKANPKEKIIFKPDPILAEGLPIRLNSLEK